MDPMSRIVESVLEQTTEGGRVEGYFRSAGHWEGPVRRGLNEMMRGLEIGDPNALAEADWSLRHLNWGYRTRLPVGSVRLIARTALNMVERGGWLHRKPVALWGCSEGDVKTLAEFVPEALDAIREAGVPGRPYSFVTKLLHFCFPESFPICDSRAASSIQMWSYAAYPDGGQDRERFEWGRLADPSGDGYDGVVEFYRRFWDAASAGQRSELAERSKEMERIIGARVGILDLLDKLLWDAKGDPLPLGLRVVAR